MLIEKVILEPGFRGKIRSLRAQVSWQGRALCPFEIANLLKKLSALDNRMLQTTIESLIRSLEAINEDASKTNFAHTKNNDIEANGDEFDQYKLICMALDRELRPSMSRVISGHITPQVRCQLVSWMVEVLLA